jgi:hypothetical protein
LDGREKELQSKSMTSSATMTARLLPRNGDEVRIEGLQGAREHNGKKGKVLSFVNEKGRYKVQLKTETGSEHLLAVKLKNLITLPRGKAELKSLHLLVPCHIDSDRRLCLFMRSAKSICYQTSSDFSVFVGLSGPDYFRQNAAFYLSVLVTKCNASIRWYLQDDEVPKRSQIEHIRHLVENGSCLINPDALISFLDNDDMCHPCRIFSLLSVYSNMPDFASGGTLGIPCKLLLDSSVTSEEGQLEHFINLKQPTDYCHWEFCSAAEAGKVQLVTNSQAKVMDAEEYFDFIVPTTVMKKFFALTPPKVADHRFCDLRLFQVLSYLQPIELDDVFERWMVAHYKIPEDEMRKCFDNHGQLTSHSIHAPDQASAFDSKNTWKEMELEKARVIKVSELNQLYGKGFGDNLWEECCTSMLTLFDSETLEASKDTWECAWG